MSRLVLAELRASWASWLGVIIVSAITALACGIAVSMLETGIHAGGDYVQGFSGGTAAILMFSAPAGIAVIAAITRLAVDLGRPEYARWQLAGVSPTQTSLVVSAQVVAASLLRRAHRIRSHDSARRANNPCSIRQWVRRILVNPGYHRRPYRVRHNPTHRRHCSLWRGARCPHCRAHLTLSRTSRARDRG